MTKGKKAIAIVLLGWSMVHQAHAATWKSSTTKDGRIVVSISGDYFRVCQPELKVCNTGISYRDKNGRDMMIKVIKDMNDALLTREICSFNEMGDIRVCTDWDKNTTHRDMKDAKGEWYKVADE